jgi:glutamine cyclotransferase
MSPSEEVLLPPVEKAEKYQGNIPAKTLKRVKIPKGWHEGLFFDGKLIWVMNGKGGNIWKVDTEAEEVVDTITPVGPFTEGLTSAGDGTYWLTDWDDKKIYRVRTEGDTMTADYDVSVAPALPAGIVWTGERLYVVTWTRGLAGTKFHLLELDRNETVFRKFEIKGILEPAHLAWDGRYLWVTSWYSRLVYKIDPVTHSVLGHFKSPASETTGIVWDGKSFWITGTKADLYQVELVSE